MDTLHCFSLEVFRAHCRQIYHNVQRQYNEAACRVALRSGECTHQWTALSRRLERMQRRLCSSPRILAFALSPFTWLRAVTPSDVLSKGRPPEVTTRMQREAIKERNWFPLKANYVPCEEKNDRRGAVLECVSTII